jgi:hypothetical protein
LVPKRFSKFLFNRSSKLKYLTNCMLISAIATSIIQRSVYAHSLICISYWTYEIDYCSLFLSFHEADLRNHKLFFESLIFSR